MGKPKLQKNTSLLPKVKTFINKYFSWEFIKTTPFNSKLLIPLAVILTIVDFIISVFVVNRVKYTEIDWVAYMQEVGGVLNGTLDYSKLKGDTGPLVYPAGFVYIYSFLYYITSQGTNVKLAQYIFVGLYVILLILIFRIYIRSKKVPPYMLVLMCLTSYRIHSIFMLRLFNDSIAVILLYAAINLFLDSRWSLGSSLYSLAVSVKMNILLYSPALLLAYLTCLGLRGTVMQLAICGIIQLLLGAPFLLENPLAYLQGSFDIGRVFMHQWTVNWRFLPEDIFVNRIFHIALLTLHLILLSLFFTRFKTYFQSYARLRTIERDIQKQLKTRKETVDMGTVSQLFLLPMFTANFIGIACSRSLHYQFYVWYYHTLPYLLWSTDLSTKWKLVILGFIEYSWNNYPSTDFSSAVLHICHIALLFSLFKTQGKTLQNKGSE